MSYYLSELELWKISGCGSQCLAFRGDEGSWVKPYEIFKLTLGGSEGVENMKEIYNLKEISPEEAAMILFGAPQP